MHRAKSICTWPGCATLVDRPGRCAQHPYESIRHRLRESKTKEKKNFYSGSKWTKTSKHHREYLEPFCRRCLAIGICERAKVAHHNPEREILIARGDSPYDHQFIESLCFNCHQRELRRKRNG